MSATATDILQLGGGSGVFLGERVLVCAPGTSTATFAGFSVFVVDAAS
jgi:hypothetical protein